MKSKFSKFLTLFFCLVMGMNVWGETVKWTANETDVTTLIGKGVVTVGSGDYSFTLQSSRVASGDNNNGSISWDTSTSSMKTTDNNLYKSGIVIKIPATTASIQSIKCEIKTDNSRKILYTSAETISSSSKPSGVALTITKDFAEYSPWESLSANYSYVIGGQSGGSGNNYVKSVTIEFGTAKTVDHTTIVATDVKVNGVAQGASFTAGVWDAPATLKYAEEPAVKFVKTTTTYYKDGTNDGGKSEDVDAESVTKNGNLWVATATIGETTYTANLPVDNNPVMNLSTESGTLALGVAPSKSLTVTLTGANLTDDGTYDVTVPAVEGLSIAPAAFTVADGAVDQEFTITYASAEDVAEATADLVFSDGTTSKTFTLTYSSVSAYDLQDVSEAITWDWSKLSVAVNAPAELQGDGGIKLSAGTTPSISDEVLYANAYYISVAAGFDAQKIAFIGQYPVRSKMCQNGTIKFHTTIPGYITVKFSDTGSSVDANAHKRYLNVNGVNTEYWTSRPTSGSTKSNDTKTSGKIFVPAGDVTIKAMKEDGETSTAICVYIVTFTPAYTREIDQIGTICLANGIVSCEGATLYEISHKVVENDIVKSIVLVEATEFVAGRPYIFEPVDNATTLTCELNSTVAAEAGSHNGLIGSYTTEYITGAEDNNTDIYVVYNNKVMLCGTNNKVGANRAYIKMSDVPAEQPASVAGRRQLVINNANAPQTPTDIESINAETVAQKVMINGQVFILRGEKLYTTQGQLVK